VSGFVRDRRSGRIVATFLGVEADLLRSLASQVVELLHHERATPEHSDPLEAMLDFSGPTTEPDDPVLARLFPSAYDDAEDAAEFRRFTEGTLRAGKAATAGAIIDALEDAGLPPELTEDGLVFDVELDRESAEQWLRAFTDIRLALAVRLEVEADDEARWEAMDDDDPRKQAHDLYSWLGYLQETLVEAVMA